MSKLQNNPDVANVFFRSGEIESWGRGIEKIFSACRKSDSPPPEIHVDGYDLWVEFGFSPQYMAVIEGKTENGKNNIQDRTTGEGQNRPGGLVDGLVENQKKILQTAKDNPRISIREMAEKIGISTTAIDKNIEKLKRMGLLRRVGSPKGGYWDVLV